LSRSRLAELYKRESNTKVKERLLLIMRVKGDEQLPAHVVKAIHRSKPWASYWLDRHTKEGIEGLRDKPKSGRTPHIPLEVSARIRKRLTESNRQGWTTQQVNDIIVRESGIQYHYTHVYRLLHKWGFKQKVPRKVHVNTLHQRRKRRSSKKSKGNSR
jgi:putative transposase